MTNDWQERKGLILGLGMIGATVWGYNVYAVANAAGGGAAAPPVLVATESAEVPHFADPGRDPFAPPAGVDLDPPQEDTSGYGWVLPPDAPGAWEEPPPEPVSDALLADGFEHPTAPEPPLSLGPPPFTFAGVVGRAALLQDPSGESVPVRTGETIAGFRVTRVSQDAVTLADGPRSYTLGFLPTTPFP